MAIIIYLNGKKEETESGTSISMLLDAKKIRPEVVTVELNDEIIGKDKYQATKLKPNDKLEFVYYMGGGGSTRFARSPFISKSAVSNHPERMSKASESKDRFYVYILRCEDGSLYTGITNNLKKRLKDHFIGKGSFYTKYNRPIKIVDKEKFSTLLGAKKRELQIKGWTRRKKEALINGDLQLLKKL